MIWWTFLNCGCHNGAVGCGFVFCFVGLSIILVACLVGWLVGWLDACLLACWLLGWLGWLAACLPGWFVGELVVVVLLCVGVHTYQVSPSQQTAGQRGCVAFREGIQQDRLTWLFHNRFPQEHLWTGHALPLLPANHVGKAALA